MFWCLVVFFYPLYHCSDFVEVSLVYSFVVKYYYHYLGIENDQIVLKDQLLENVLVNIKNFQS